MGNFVPSEWFGQKNPMTVGLECEIILFDGEQNRLLHSSQLHRAEKAWQNLPPLIYKDYYSYQGEIRTNPHDNPQDAIKQLIELYRLADEEFARYGIFMVPVPWVGMGDDSYCGMHVHVRYMDEQHNKEFYRKAWGALPFIYALADHTKNAETSEFESSVRLAGSHHIKLPYVREQDFWIGTGEHRWRDVTVNKLKTDPHEPKKTVKTVETLETRIFDTPSLLPHLRLIVEGTYNIYAHIKAENPVTKAGVENLQDKFSMTRELAIKQRYGTNKILRDANFNIVEGMCNYFGMEFPRETQFEFREQFSGLKDPVKRKLVMRRFSWGL